MPLRDVAQDCVFGPLASHEGTVCLNHDVAGAAPRHDVVAWEPGVQFPLSHGDLAAGAGAVLGFEILDVQF